MIYFIQADDPVNHIKIGFTDGDPLDRLRALQTSSPVRLHLLASMLGTQQDEAALHRRFASAHVQGEWFRPTPAILQIILTRQPAPETPARLPPAEDVSDYAPFLIAKIEKGKHSPAALHLAERAYRRGAHQVVHAFREQCLETPLPDWLRLLDLALSTTLLMRRTIKSNHPYTDEFQRRMGFWGPWEETP